MNTNNNFECIRCGYETNKRCNIIIHLNRINKCAKRIESFICTNEEVVKLSMIRKNDRGIIKNRCKYCNNNYSSKYFLDKHIKEYCKKNNNTIIEETIIAGINIAGINIEGINIEETNIDETNIDETNIEDEKNTDKKNIDKLNKNNKYVENTIIENQQNNTINNNIYIINIPNIPNIPVSFDKEWNTDHIDIYLKQVLLLTDNKYTELLKQILENKNNLNVIIDKNTDVGYIYDSDNKYKNMEKSEIVNKSMEKLYNQLNKIRDEVINNSKIPINISKESNLIENKYNDYINDKNTQKTVNDCISDIFDKTKKDAFEIFNNINSMKIEGY